MSESAMTLTPTEMEKDVQVGEHSNNSSSEINFPSKESRITEPKDSTEAASAGFLTKILSKTTSRISIDPGPPPDGGLAAWTQVLMGHLIIFNTWGYIISFGVFQTYYVTALGHPPSDISWVCTSLEGLSFTSRRVLKWIS